MRTPVALLRLLAGPVLLVAQSAAADFTVSSPSVTPGERIPEKHVFKGFGCAGGNVSPALAWKGAPEGTKSFAVTVFDPDAPTGSGWWHWVLYDLPPDATSLPEGASGGKGIPPGAVQGRTDYGAVGYGGPCPPAGDRPHRYVFTVSALKVAKLDVPPDATAAMIGFAVNANLLARASIEAKYGRR